MNSALETKGNSGFLWHVFGGVLLCELAPGCHPQLARVVSFVVVYLGGNSGRAHKLIADSDSQVRDGIQTGDGCLEITSLSLYVGHFSNSAYHIS